MSLQHLAPWLNRSIVFPTSVVTAVVALVASIAYRVPLGPLYVGIALIAGLIGACLGVMLCLQQVYVREHGWRKWGIASFWTWVSVSTLGLVYPLFLSPGSWSDYLYWVATGIVMSPMISLVNGVPSFKPEPSDQASPTT